MRARVTLAAMLVALPACSFIDDFSHFHTDAGTADGGAVDAPVSDLGAATDLGHTLTEAEFLAAYAAHACDLLLHCESKVGIAVLLEVVCNPSAAAYLFSGGRDTTLPAGATFDPVAAQACLDATAMLSTTDCAQIRAAPPAACDGVFVGTLPVGMPCVSSAQCTSGNCPGGSSTCGGTCAAAPSRAGPGTPCTSNDQCDASLRCRGSMCTTPGDTGQVCDEPSDCMDMLWCSSTSGSCLVLPNIGEPCDVGFGGDPCQGSQVCTVGTAGSHCEDGVAMGATCDSGHPCQPALRCSPSTMMCKPLSGPGGPCMSPENCPAEFACSANVCVPLPALGQPCNALLPCFIGSCVMGLCAPAANGMSCDPMVADACTGQCDMMTRMCIASLAPGATCTVDAQCGAHVACAASVDGGTVCTPCM